MSRQVLDGMIIAALLALAATYLYAQALSHRTVLHPDQALVAVAAATESSPAAAPVVRIGTWTRTSDARRLRDTQD